MVLVLDGGLATELEARGHDLSGALWSARLLSDDPDAITAAHRAFFDAGADIATTASYQASPPALGAEAERLLRDSVPLARAAMRTPDNLVAASVGPYGAALADGSEYRGRYGLSVARLRDWHRLRIEILADEGPDLLALETIPDLIEAEALAGLLPGLGVPAWLSYTISGERTAAGQPLTEAFAIAAGVPEIRYVGVNCCDPADVLPAVELAHAVTGKPVIAYPNSGETWNGGWSGRSTYSPALVADWIAAGAEIIGGCCRVGPALIAELAAIVAP
ncbi:homocysteine S-methyltransferase [Pseudonocardiaceae bacterium YIM PH 21723]|nr:homocysteine S-methyltransferase [Pseudonocardiaceae bacterium YIM PH 21723]